MRKLLCLLVLLGVALCASAQQSPAAAPTGWAKVQALKPGATVHIKTRTGSTTAKATCIVSAVDADSLTCRGAAGNTFPRADIRRITVSHRLASTIAGVAIGAGAGAIIGGASASKAGFFSKGEVAAVIAIPGAIIGGIVGASTDFTHSTLYRAP